MLTGPGADRSAWQMLNGGGAVTWAMSDGVLETGKGLIRTRAEFTDYQLHVEFATPAAVKGNSQEQRLAAARRVAGLRHHLHVAAIRRRRRCRPAGDRHGGTGVMARTPARPVRVCAAS